MEPRTFTLKFSSHPSGYYRVDITDEDRKLSTAIISITGNLADQKERRLVLDSFFSSGTFAYVLRKCMFPEDTQIYDTEKTVHGVKLINPRYPNGKPEKADQTATTH